uniref:Uncharacterized protein n=1 Tax=Oryctolagus cuniculus TaxID=9986 RepID=A0A5F9CJX5_RABIT
FSEACSGGSQTAPRQERFLREPRPLPSPPGPSARAIGGDGASITSRGGPLPVSARRRRQQPGGEPERRETRPGGSRCSSGRGRRPVGPREVPRSTRALGPAGVRPRLACETLAAQGLRSCRRNELKSQRAVSRCGQGWGDK